MRKRQNDCRRGFTLLEILVVVIIIAVLTAIAAPKYFLTVQITKIKSHLTEMRQLMDAQERYFLATGKYSCDIRDLDISVPYDSYNFYPPNQGFCMWATYYTKWGYFELYGQNTNGKMSVLTFKSIPDFAIVIYPPSEDRSKRLEGDNRKYNGQCEFFSEDAEAICSKMGGEKLNDWSYGIYF